MDIFGHTANENKLLNTIFDFTSALSTDRRQRA